MAARAYLLHRPDFPRGNDVNVAYAGLIGPLRSVTVLLMGVVSPSDVAGKDRDVINFCLGVFKLIAVFDVRRSGSRM